MIDIDHVRIAGFEPAIRGMRNSYNSWQMSDSKVAAEPLTTEPAENFYIYTMDPVLIGIEDYKLICKLIMAGEPHCKFRRMIQVWMDICAPLYWWKQFDTYKIGTTANSTSTMHNITDKYFTVDDFSFSNAMSDTDKNTILDILNEYRKRYLAAKNDGKEEIAKNHWNAIITALPESYNQLRTININYAALAGIYKQRKGHKLLEWKHFCEVIEFLPRSWIITGNTENYTPYSLTH